MAVTNSGTDRREITRPTWIRRLAGVVRRHGVVHSTLFATLISVVGSTIFCHALYSFYGVPRVGVALIMPTLAPLVIAPPMLYVLIRAIDLLGRVESEVSEQRQRLQNAVEVAQQQALKADSAARAKSDFLAHMSHELRTPLNAILGFSETIRDTRLGPIGTEAYRDYAGHIHQSGTHLLSLINDILDMSRIESGKMELDRGRHDASELVNECWALVAAEAESKNLSFDTSGIETGLGVSGDRRAIKQVMINLLSNAVKFTPKDGRINVDAANDGANMVVLTVTDTGAGIAPEDIERIFEPFIRLEHAETGTGLGLPLAKGLVELHGGELSIESDPGSGTSVRATFPDRP